MTRISLFAATTLATTLALAGCSREAPDAANNAEARIEPAAPVSAAFVSGADQPMGSVTLSEDPTGVTIRIDAAAMPAGVHGVHLHETGQCEGPKFASAGAHWNPGAKQHGRDNPAGAHLGDLANFTVAADGSGATTFLVSGATMNGANTLADAGGTSLVIHAKADDYKTDPSGDSGDRVACAVIAPPK